MTWRDVLDHGWGPFPRSRCTRVLDAVLAVLGSTRSGWWL